jgi:hypothetical protein
MTDEIDYKEFAAKDKTNKSQCFVIFMALCCITIIVVILAFNVLFYNDIDDITRMFCIVFNIGNIFILIAHVLDSNMLTFLCGFTIAMAFSILISLL